ncbi:MAG: isopeptide-forming domain-containing fimbrial protein [Corynebacterium humireducens]|jgi:fimbrial isopeptide formation D2 family protein/LPXTG-motif cell wall-anchored protein|uniref:Isopeptide-forming domain-containing fimbrial protein n=1 Tax=Corynebacterium humireducens TaxID=1223514 RepID=A0A7X6PKL1_9CORY|nr:isopeptide-forming domain-containing fimbrial protein [Corynebacterium humireducens]
MHKSNKRIAAAVVALALGFSTAGAGVFAPVAGAQDTTPAPIASTVNADAPASLTIQKYIGMPVGGSGEYNTEIQDELDKLAPGAGFVFDIYALDDYDLTTQAGWAALAGITAADIGTDALGNPTVATTGSDGTITTELAVGAYLVKERDRAGYEPAPAFIVTLPFVNSDGVWDYNQTVRPKNQAGAISIEKDVEDTGVTLNETLTYTIKAKVPEGTLEKLQFVDELPTELEFVEGSATVTAGATVVPATATVDTDNKLVINVTDLAAVQAARTEGEDLYITAEFQAKVAKLPTDNVIENHALIDFGGELKYSTDPDHPDYPGDEDTGAETHLGSLTINKYNNATPQELITSDEAKFQLYRCTGDDTNGYTTSGSPLKAVTGATGTTADVFSTGNAGTVTLQGVQMADWVNGAEATDTLCIVEIEAPEGFVINPEPQPVTVDGYTMAANVTNLPDDVTGQLPATGGQGTMALIAAGVLVAAAGGAASVRANRARR